MNDIEFTQYDSEGRYMREHEPEAVEAAFEEERQGSGNFYRLPDHEGEALEPGQLRRAEETTMFTRTLIEAYQEGIIDEGQFLAMDALRQEIKGGE